MTVGEALTEGAALLTKTIDKTPRASLPRANIETPALDASLLLGHILGKDRAGLVLARPEPVPPAALDAYCLSLDRRLAGECVARVVGHREFRGLDFTVTPDVLVPRPDTETLVEAALARVDARGSQKPFSLLDLCTGSGAVAVSLKHERPGLDVYASDISGAALLTARANAARLLPPAASNPEESAPGVGFLRGDLFAALLGLPEENRSFDLITANPPYIPAGMIDTLAPEVRGEPRLALDGGEDGLKLIRSIIADAPRFLKPGGGLLLEADPGQMGNIGHLLASRGYTGIELYRDLAGRRRVIGGTFGG
ncbi:MAG: peptide chain release factor N(5)-glutamine methyltransferase [Spirochaetaceae bacterium]|jgi:release factor glutamine methyltransferase|nr:peptide chain release factor N(5)-glutamine methyltransferase [Spirochaetaceae bacterium]